MTRITFYVSLTFILHQEMVMLITKLSSKGQVIIPKTIRLLHHWESGQALVVEDVGNGIILKPLTPFNESTLDDVAGCLKYDGKPKSIDDMHSAIAQ